MATPESATVALLRQIPELSVLVGDRIHADELPQDCLYPAISYERVSTERASFRDVTSGRSGYAQVRMQIDAWALSRSAALAVSGPIVASLEGYSGIADGLKIDEAWIEDESGGKDPDVAPGGQSIYRQRVDLMLLGPF
jgi:Protein of unknown function (DUF3168)